MSALLEDYRWLTSSAAQPWLARAGDGLAEGQPLLQLVQSLRRDLSLQRAHLAAQQAELRRQAAPKFTRAAQMFFTPRGLEQATDEAIARYKAVRFGSSEAVADLCCGVGGDLVSLGRDHCCTGVDRDPVAVHLARANADALGLEQVTVICDDASVAPVESCAAWHIDPDRRIEGGRTVRAERFEPPWTAAQALLARCGNAAVKLAPATELAENDAAACERQWIESRGECRQQVAWFGSLARHPGWCSATVIRADGEAGTIVGKRGTAVAAAAAIGRYVYEPCAAVRAARLVGALCERTGLACLSNVSMYLTGDFPLNEPLAAGFEVLECLPLDLRRLRQALRERRIGHVEVKKRGVKIDPERVRREVAGAEGEPAAVLIGPFSGRTMAIVARRLGLVSRG
jgi:hypothetical protein